MLPVCAPSVKQPGCVIEKFVLAVKASWVQFFAELVPFLFTANYFRVQTPSVRDRAYMSTQGVDVRYSSPHAIFDFEV
jgi:hypothetical protein